MNFVTLFQGTDSHRSGQDDLELQLQKVLGPKEIFLEITEDSRKHFFGITPQPATPVTSKDYFGTSKTSSSVSHSQSKKSQDDNKSPVRKGVPSSKEKCSSDSTKVTGDEKSIPKALSSEKSSPKKNQLLIKPELSKTGDLIKSSHSKTDSPSNDVCHNGSAVKAVKRPMVCLATFSSIIFYLSPTYSLLLLL